MNSIALKMMNTSLLIIAVLMNFYATADAQNNPPTLSSLASPDISGGYNPGTTYNMNVAFSENSNLRAYRMKIYNPTNPGVIGATQPVGTAVDTFTINSTFYIGTTDTSGSSSYNFKWTAPNSTETVKFELRAYAANIGGSGITVTYLCNYEVTTSGFGLVGTCSNSLSVGIDEHAGTAGLAVFPNPANEKLTVAYTLTDEAKTTIRLFDLSGKLIQTIHQAEDATGTHEQSMDVSDFASGLYIVQIELGDKTYYDKISIQ